MFWQSVLNGIVAGSTYALIALGFSVIYQAARFFHLSHGAVFAGAAYAAYYAATRLHCSPLSALLFAVVVGVVLGVECEREIYRHLRHRGDSSVSLLIASLGILIVIQNVISLCFGDATLVFPSNTAREGMTVVGGHITDIQVMIIGANLVLTIGAWWLLRCTTWGKLARAIGCDTELGLALGLNRDAVTVVAFAVGSAYASVAGVLSGYDNSLSPGMGFRAILVGVVAFIVGGTNNILGAVFGGLLVGLAENVGICLFAARWQDVIVFAVLMIFLVFRPHGLLGSAAGRERL